MLILVKILYTTIFIFCIRHSTIANNNSNNACIAKNVNVIESSISTIHPNSNFDNIADTNIAAINEGNEINSISKVTILEDLIKACKYFLKTKAKIYSQH